MCGFNGFTFSDGDALRRMHDVTRPRGPDDEGFFESPQISLAHNRLSIIDLSPAGHQPMETPDGRYVIVFNGEIYNFQDLRRELEAFGRTFRSQSDTEVLLAAFAQWGKDCLVRLNGIFAFALWDRQTETLLLARDHMGVKPLYYSVDERGVIFSSEMKAILAHGVRQEIDVDALNLFFRFLYVPGPRTMVRGILKLQPGTLAIVKDGRLTVEQWWQVREGSLIEHRAEAEEMIRSLAQDSVRRQLVSDRPVGVFLSGGIDSTAILGLMRSVHTGSIKTFSVGYEPTPEAEKYNADFVVAAKTARHFGAEHFPLIISGKEVATNFEKIISAMDEPVSNHVQPSTYFLAKFAKPEITVALGGDGGDELFGGYDRYWYCAMLDRIQALPAPLRHPRLLAIVGQILSKKSLVEKVGLTAGVDRYLAFLGQKDATVRSIFCADQYRPDVARQTFAPYFEPSWRDTTNQFMAVDAQTWLPDESLMRSDRMTMAHGLEERVPFLDPRLVELAYRIPSRFKIDRQSLGKMIFRDALAPYLPDFVTREKKRGFFSPAAKWLRTDMLGFAREALSDGYDAGSAGFLDLQAARQMLEDHVEKRAYHLNEIWAILTFRAWYRSVFS